ncbi:hypothetical protein [Pimelobacter simplex]|uniref:hypothetical protein n=1 Tax=Nocardioides simplex TaxID=2045 RepID=UPI003AADF554
MENFVMIPAMTSAWQRPLSPSAFLGCATSALPTFEVQGIAARAIAPNAAFAPFATLAAAVATDAVKRERAHAGMGRRGTTTAYVPGSLAWSPPI